MAIKDFMDYNNYGGAVVLGAKKQLLKDMVVAIQPLFINV